MEYVQLMPKEEIILLELGVPSSSCMPRVLRAFAPFSDYFLALTNNYIQGDYMPPKEDIDKIKEYFGLDGPPLWYLDAEGYQRWGYHTLDKRKHS
ncbi:hypothetical protein BDZ97DRAFT_1852345 [Flammula alnicola]|nr:hypothetical protein BDZ97DRAFT_1852345 [Flammula alnicola]